MRRAGMIMTSNGQRRCPQLSDDHGRAPAIIDARGAKIDILMDAFIRSQRRNSGHAEHQISCPHKR